MPRHDPRPAYRCRADAEARNGGYKRCGRKTKAETRVCHDHKHFAEHWPDITICAPESSDHALLPQSTQARAA
jgi:hypothetical protein